MYSAFYAELNEARREIGDDKFADWCFSELRISLSILTEARRILRAADAAVVQADFAQARAAEKQAKKAAAAVAAQARQIAREERNRQIAEKNQQQAKERRRVTKQRHRENRRMRLLQLGPENPDLVRLLAECEAIEKPTRAELGRRYLAMKHIVENHEAGRNERDEYWTWVGWAAAHIERSRRDINRCIADFGTSCPNEQDENVIHFPKSVA
jgi:multidrug efflux pump subunit AcrA (membrane-fusion protein)